MTLPKLSQLRAGVGVNIVLKADQPTGKQTTGHISKVLTRGDHPRGVKVQLSNGQVGRVQSLSTAAPIAAPTADCATHLQVELKEIDSSLGREKTEGRGRQNRGRYHIQEDYRQDNIAADSRSLVDYIKPSRRRVRIPKAGTNEDEETTQARLESEFPKLDTALIAAILADHGSGAKARNLLMALA